MPTTRLPTAWFTSLRSLRSSPACFIVLRSSLTPRTSTIGALDTDGALRPGRRSSAGNDRSSVRHSRLGVEIVQSEFKIAVEEIAVVICAQFQRSQFQVARDDSSQLRIGRVRERHNLANVVPGERKESGFLACVN